MCFALHREGLFTKVNSVPRDISPGLRKWERENEKAIRAVAEFMKLVVREVTSASKHGSTKFALIRRTWEKEKEVKLYRLQDDYTSALPVAARERLESALQTGN